MQFYKTSVTTENLTRFFTACAGHCHIRSKASISGEAVYLHERQVKPLDTMTFIAGFMNPNPLSYMRVEQAEAFVQYRGVEFEIFCVLHDVTQNEEGLFCVDDLVRGVINEIPSPSLSHQ